MNSTNFHKAVDLANKLNRPATLKNEDGRIIHTVSESSRMIYDDANEAYISIRTNVDYTTAHDYPFTITRMEYDSIKLIEIDVTVEELKHVIEDEGESWDDYKDFIAITRANATSSPKNFNKKYAVEVDPSTGDVRKVPVQPQYDKVPRVELGF